MLSSRDATRTFWRAAHPGPRGATIFCLPAPANRSCCVLEDAWKSERCSDVPATGVPFYGGWFLYLGYELAGQIEPVLKLPADSSGLPIACATRFPAAVIVDRHRGQGFIVAEQPQLIDAIRADIARLPAHIQQAGFAPVRVNEDDPGQFIRAAGRVLDYIREGDVFQVNLSRQWCARWPSAGPFVPQTCLPQRHR